MTSNKSLIGNRSISRDIGKIILGKRKILEKLNRRNIFVEIDPSILLIIAGYTRSGTTFYARLLANTLKARYIHEPLNPHQVKQIAFFHERESGYTIRTSDAHRKAIYRIFSPGFRGNKHTNSGGLFFYRHRIIKIVRGNFYLDALSMMLPNARISFIIRHPCACVSSRMALGWNIPDHSKCIDDVWPRLTSEQKNLIKTADSKHMRIAISWCLDNMMALENARKDFFRFIYYENLVLDIRRQIQEILSFLGKNYETYQRRMELELAMEQRRNSDPWIVINKWKKMLSKEVTGDIMKVVKVFNLDYLYDSKTQMPNDVFCKPEQYQGI